MGTPLAAGRPPPGSDQRELPRRDEADVYSVTFHSFSFFHLAAQYYRPDMRLDDALADAAERG